MLRPSAPLTGHTPPGENHPLRLPAPQVPARPGPGREPRRALLQEHGECGSHAGHRLGGDTGASSLARSGLPAPRPRAPPPQLTASPVFAGDSSHAPAVAGKGEASRVCMASPLSAGLPDVPKTEGGSWPWLPPDFPRGGRAARPRGRPAPAGAARAVLTVPECSPPQPCSEVRRGSGQPWLPLGKGSSDKSPPAQHTVFSLLLLCHRTLRLH